MTLGIILLCHTALDRVAQLARHFAQAGCPVVLHLDARVPPRAAARLRTSVDGLPGLRHAPRHRCEWGGWGLVAATLGAAETMLADFPQVRHVCLASGACLPLRPPDAFRQYLADRPRVDFIESVTTGDVAWTVGGLDIERFTLRFPFAWRRRRWLFDRHVALQRRLGLRRRIPDGIEPHLGSQWWCLTRETLQAILTDPRRAEFDAYFRRVWIPDESYFQTLVRRHARQIESRSLTLSKFDFQGKPHVFYDDHLDLLRRSDRFMARKIWPRADGLYAALLAPEAAPVPKAAPDPGRIDRLFAAAADRRTRGRAGLWMQSRFPNDGWDNGLTAAPYAVFQGFAELLEGFAPWLAAATGARVHGHLYAPDRVAFADQDRIGPGALSDSAAIRDHNPAGFLTSLIWNTKGQRQCFQFGPADRQEIGHLIAADPNAQVWAIRGAWALPLLRSGGSRTDLRSTAAEWLRTEARHLDLLGARQARARLRVWTLAEFVADPDRALRTVLDDLAPRSASPAAAMPRLVDLAGLGDFLRDLRDQGLQPGLLDDPPPPARAKPLRPRLAG